jgi:signal transduction histidine kinase
MLASVADTGRKALDETGRLLHLIRDDGDELGLNPAPGLADVPHLVSTFRESGLDVVDDVDLPTMPLPGGVDVSTYRVVQEALTNALKYAEGPVDLSISSTPDELQIRCANRVGRAGSNGSGLGIQGMAERVGLLGGTLTSGPTPDGRFAIEVDIPLLREGVS